MKAFIFSVLLLAFFNTQAQDIVFKYDKKFRNVAMPKSYKSFVTINDNTGELHLTIADNKSIERFIIDSNWQVLKQMTSPRGYYAQFPYERFNTLQLFASDKKEYNVYNFVEKRFELNEMNYDKQEEIALSKFELKRKESIIANFTTDNIFCLIIAGNNEQLKFITNAKSGGIAFDTLYINEPNISISENLKTAAIIGPDERDLRKLLEKNKIYFTGKKVFITIDKPGGTYTTEVDLASGNIKHNVFVQQYPGSMPNNPKPELYNSFLWGNILVNGNVYNSNLAVTFFDYEKGSFVNHYTVAKNDSINFNNGAILNRKDKPITITDFIRKAVSGDGLVVELSAKETGQVELVVEICDIKTPVRYGGGGIRYSTIPGNTVQTPGGAVTIASPVFTQGNWVRGEDVIYKNAYFKSVFKTGTLEHVKNEGQTKSISKLLENELEELDEHSAISIFRKNQVLYIGFYDSKKEAFVIKKIASVNEQ